MRRVVAGLSCVLAVLAGFGTQAAGAASAAPTVTSLSAHYGPIAGGETITVHGTNLGSAHAADFATIRAAIRVVSSSTVRVRIPRVSSGQAHHLVIYTSAGRSAATARDVYTFVAPPRIVEVLPNATALAGSTITLHGSALRDVRSVTFGGVAGRVTGYRGDVSLAVLAPRHAAGTVDVVVRTAYGTSNAARLTYIAPPTVEPLSRPYGPITGSNGFTIRGSGFVRGRTVVTLGGHTVAIADNSTSTTLEVGPVAAHAAGEVTLTVSTPYGSAAGTGTYTYEVPTAPDLRAVPLDTPGTGDAVAVSCVSATFCADADSRSVSLFDGSSWSAPTALRPDGDLRSVSCSSASFCVALGGTSSSYVFDGTSWTQLPTGSDAFLTSVSCPRDGSCVAVGERTTVVLADGTWTERTSAALSAGGLGRLSCVSADFCMSVSSLNTVYRFDGTTWSTTVLGSATTHLSDVSCVSTTFCAIVTEQGGEWEYTGTSWTRVRELGDYGAQFISCSAASTCVVADHLGVAVTAFDATTTSGPAVVLRGGDAARALSCTASGFCLLADAYGRVATNAGTGWTSPTVAVVAEGWPDAVSCPAAGVCFSADRLGNVYRLDAGTWGDPVPVDPEAYLTQRVHLSCGSPTSCVLGDSTGFAATYDGVSWSPTTLSAALVAVSCAPGTATCVAISATAAYRHDAAGWSPATAAPQDGLSDVSCSTATLCRATAASSVLEFTGSAWVGAARITSPGGAPAAARTVSCASTSCLIGDGYGGFAILGSSAATAVLQPRGNFEGRTLSTCSASGFCVNAGSLYVQTFDSGTWSVPSAVEGNTGGLLFAVAAYDRTHIAVVDAQGVSYLSS